MDILERIIENLTSDEVRRFKILSNRFKADEEKKMLILFNEIRAGQYKDREDEVILQLYGEIQARTKNSYYRLRNKLLSNLEKSLLFYHFNYKNKIEAYSYLQLSLLMQERDLYREAFYHLKKGKKAAQSHDQFNVLDLIYDQMILLAPHSDIDIQEVIGRRRKNRKQLETLRASREVIGLITSELSRKNYARGRNTSDVINTLEKVKRELEEHQSMFQTASGKILIMQAVTSILIQKGAYAELADYAQETLSDFLEHGVFEEGFHDQQLRLRIIRINALHKTLMLEDAKSEIQLFFRDLDRSTGSLYAEYAYHYFLSSAFNLKLAGSLEEAEKILEEGLAKHTAPDQSERWLYLMMSMADLHFISEQYLDVLNDLKAVMNHREFGKIGDNIRLSLCIFYLVSLYEAEMYPEFGDSLRNLRKEYRAQLKDEDYAIASKFLDILTRMATAAEENRSMHLKAAHKNYLKEFGTGEIGDNHIIRYDLYLESKVEGHSYLSLLQDQVKG